MSLSITADIEARLRGEAERSGRSVSEVAREFMLRGMESTVRRRRIVRKDWVKTLHGIQQRIERQIVEDWPDQPEVEVRRVVRQLMADQPYDELLTIDEWKQSIDLGVTGRFRPDIMGGGAGP